MCVSVCVRSVFDCMHLETLCQPLPVKKFTGVSLNLPRVDGIGAPLRLDADTLEGLTSLLSGSGDGEIEGSKVIRMR